MKTRRRISVEGDIELRNESNRPGVIWLTDHEEDWYVMAENAHCSHASLIPAGCRKSLGNEDIQPAYGWVRRGLMTMMLADEPVMNIMNVKVIH